MGDGVGAGAAVVSDTGGFEGTGAAVVPRAKERGVVIEAPLPTHDVMSTRAREGGWEREGEREGEGVSLLPPRSATVSQGSTRECSPEGNIDDYGATGDGGDKTAEEDATGETVIKDEGLPSKARESSNKRETRSSDEDQLNREGANKDVPEADRKDKNKNASAREHARGDPAQDDASRKSHDELSLSGGMLLHGLDGSTLEPPSLEPPSPEQQGSPGTDNSDGEDQRRRDDAEGWGRKRTMTSQYVRWASIGGRGGVFALVIGLPLIALHASISNRCTARAYLRQRHHKGVGAP